MPTSRPTTPAAISDTSSDPGSLSDLDSGWTDIETNRSSGRHSPSTISDAGDSEDARSVIDRYDVEAWEGIAPDDDETGEHDVGENTFITESSPVVAPTHQPPIQPGTSELTLEDWVSDAVGSSFLSDDDRLATPQMSVHGSRSALRLAFPDPLSHSKDDLLPSSSLRRRQLQTIETSFGPEISTHAEGLSPVAEPNFTETTPSEPALSVSEEGEDDERPEIDYDIPSVELAPPSISYTLSIVLLGHPPLPHLKSMVVSEVINMVALGLDGYSRRLDGGDTARIYEVPIHTLRQESPVGACTHRVVISDRTGSLSPSSSFDTFDCATLAVVFIQPPLSSPFLPSLPFNTKYLPILLPSVSDGFASSLLDLSPSVLFGHSVPNVSDPDDASKAFALQQCEELGIIHNRLGNKAEIFTADELVEHSLDAMSNAIKEIVFPKNEKLNENSGTAGVVVSPEKQSTLAVFRKQIVFVSAFLLALLFGSTMLFRGTPSYPTSTEPSPPSQEQKAWSFLHPFVNRTPPSLPATSPPSPASPVLPPSAPHSLLPASLKSLAVSVFRPESTTNKPASSFKDHRSRPTHCTRSAAPHAVDPTPEVRPALIDPAARPLTLDAPSTKSTVPRAEPHWRWNDKAKEKAMNELPEAETPLSGSLSARISNALTPLFDAMRNDLREIEEAIDVLLQALQQALQQLRGQASQGFGELVHVLSSHTGQGMQDFATKAHLVAQSVGERVSQRHARARYNARKVRDVGERYVSAARQKFEKGVKRARGNAKEVLKEGLAMGSKRSRDTPRNAKGEHRKPRRGGRKARKYEKRSKDTVTGSFFFQSVIALVV